MSGSQWLLTVELETTSDQDRKCKINTRFFSVSQRSVLWQNQWRLWIGLIQSLSSAVQQN